jgi:ribosomal protein S18 acetylase RimI-like enzyme
VGDVHDFHLRAGVVGDVNRVLAFWAEAAENAGRPIDDRVAVAALLDHDSSALVLAESDGAVVGSLISGWDGWRFHLYRLAVLPSWRGRGVARALLNHAERRCAALGAGRVDAMVLDDNRDGVGFWRSAGYHRQDEWRRWVRALDGD